MTPDRDSIDATPWASAPMVFVQIPTCPGCGSTKHNRIRSEAAGDGSVTRKVVCTDCSTRFKIVLELPDTGNPDWDLG